MLSLFLVLAPPPQEEAKQRQGNPELVSPVRPGIRTGYTRIWRRRTERGGCAFRTPSLRVNYAARARLLLLAAIIFHLFNEGVRPRHATFRVLVPVEAVSPPGLSPRSIDSKIRVNGNTCGGDIFRAAAELSALSFEHDPFSVWLTAKS